MKRPHPHGKARDTGEIVYGLRAGLAVLASRPDDVLRVGYAQGVAREVEPVLRGLRRVQANGMADRELDRIAGGPHHEGLVLETKPRRWATPAELADRLVQAGQKGTAIALDRVRNPYNVGAILRSAAFFGIDAALLGPIAPHPALEGQAVRVAEGGVEHLLLSRTTDLADTLSRLRARGVKVFGADGQGETDALRFTFPRPCVLVMGNEREGMSARVRAQCDAIVAIRGTGNVESLNVGIAASVLLAQIVRG